MTVSAFVTFLVFAAQAQPTAAPAAPSAEVRPAPPPAGEPAPAPAQAPQAAPAPQPQYPQQPPPGYQYPYYPPPGYQGQYPNQQLVYFEYERQKKSAGLAFLGEFLLPGLGTAYTERYIHSLVTWAGMIVGIAIAVDGSNFDCSHPGSCHDGDSQVVGGLALFLAARVYGLVQSVVTANDHNDELLARLRANTGLSLNVAPLALRQGAGVGLHLTF
jgi:hypothetical protein